jgi:hypothetical protein
MIIGLSGYAGVGKDTVADRLMRSHNSVKMALADPLKRIARDVFDFSVEQLWGPSQRRNEPDLRYPRMHDWIDPKDGVYTCACCTATCRRGDQPSKDPCYLTPRYSLQILGTEWGRHCYKTVWSELGVRSALSILVDDQDYAPEHGVYCKDQYSGPPYASVVIPDIRFRSEIDVLRRVSKVPVRIVRLRRPGFDAPAYNHPSETEQASITDQEFDYIYEGSDSLDDIDQRVAVLVEALSRQP